MKWSGTVVEEMQRGFGLPESQPGVQTPPEDLGKQMQSGQEHKLSGQTAAVCILDLPLTMSSVSLGPGFHISTMEI